MSRRRKKIWTLAGLLQNTRYCCFYLQKMCQTCYDCLAVSPSQVWSCSQPVMWSVLVTESWEGPQWYFFWCWLWHPVPPLWGCYLSAKSRKGITCIAWQKRSTFFVISFAYNKDPSQIQLALQEGVSKSIWHEETHWADQKVAINEEQQSAGIMSQKKFCKVKINRQQSVDQLIPVKTT